MALDLAWVLVFALTGRLSHGEGPNPLGIMVTAWPFVVALVGTSVALIGMKRPTDELLNGLFVWLGTVVFGMWIRAKSGAGVQPSFVVVAAVILAAGLLGWRLIASRIARTPMERES